MSSGPFRLAAYVPNESVTLKPNFSYNRKAASLERLTSSVARCAPVRASTSETRRDPIPRPRSGSLTAMVLMCSSSTKSQQAQMDEYIRDAAGGGGASEIAKAKELLDWTAKVDLEEGLLRTIYWYRQRREQPSR